MRQLQLILAFCIISTIALSQSSKSYKDKDMKELKGLIVKWEKYWNTHNMDSMGTLLTTDVDFVNVSGRWLKGKKEAVAFHKERHEGVVFKESVWTTDGVTIKYIKPDLAIMHIKWGIKGDFDVDGTPRSPRKGVFTWVVTRENNEWLLLAVHNVNVRETPIK